jgi:hypothetical protein
LDRARGRYRSAVCRVQNDAPYLGFKSGNGRSQCASTGYSQARWRCHASLQRHSRLSRGHYPHLTDVEGRRIFPVILTLEDWYCNGMYLPTLLDEEVRNLMTSAGLPLEWLDQMPYAVISIDEFETAAGVTSAAGIAPFWSGKLENADHRRWPFRSYCSDCYPNETQGLPALFEDEYEAMFADLGE